MPPIFDFTSASPWILMGFLAGLLMFWLARMILGIDRKRAAAFAALESELDEARRARSALTDSKAQIDAERARLAADVNQLSPRAALLPQLERQIAAAKELDAKRLSELEAATQQLAKLREDAEGQASNAKYYESEYGRLHAAHQALNTEWSSTSNLVSKLQSEYAVASREAGEAARLRSELASAKAHIDAARADLAARTSSEQMLKNEIERLTLSYESRLNAAEQDNAQHSSEVARLTSQLSAAPKEDLSGEVQRLNGELTRLRDIESRNESLMNEVSRLKAEIAILPKVDLGNEVARLKAELAGAPKHDLSGEVARLNAENVKLRTDLASAPKADFSPEVERLNGELSRLGATLNSVRAEERNAAMELHTTRNDLSQVRMGLEEMGRLLSERNTEVEQLKVKLSATPDVENYRRFKEALEAANRIAAGLPEKA